MTKEEICSRFKNLKPHKRIDLLCGLLQMCLPSELRFIGTVVEDKGKMNFCHMREEESKANNAAELNRLKDVDDMALNTKLAVTLALLHSSNYECANIIFNVLKSYLDRMYSILQFIDATLIDMFFLVLTMAANHPALSFRQRTFMQTSLEDMERKFYPEIKPEPERYQYPCIILSHQHAAANQPNVFVKNVELNGPQRSNGEKCGAFFLQVTWSNGEITGVLKTYKELYDFQTKLISLFPEEPRLLRQDRKLSYPQGHHEEAPDVFLQAALNYIGLWNGLPQQILAIPHVVDFFRGTYPTPPVDPGLVRSHSYCQTPAMSSQMTMPIPTTTGGDSNANKLPRGLSNNQASMLSLATRNIKNRHTSIPSGPRVSSPYHTPNTSPHISPANSRSASPGNHNPESTSIYKLLQNLSLLKYRDVLGKYSIIQIKLLSFEQNVGDKLFELDLVHARYLMQLKSLADEGGFEKLNIPREPCTKLRQFLQTINVKSKSVPNGLVELCPSTSSGSPSSPTAQCWHLPPTHLPPPPTGLTPLVISSHLQNGGSEASSPSGYSSPVQSQSESIGSEDSDKEKSSSSLKLHHALRPGVNYGAPDGPLGQAVDDWSAVHLGQCPESSSDCQLSLIRTLDSGYKSDPTPKMTEGQTLRHPMILHPPPTLKQQPSHNPGHCPSCGTTRNNSNNNVPQFYSVVPGGHQPLWTLPAGMVIPSSNGIVTPMPSVYPQLMHPAGHYTQNGYNPEMLYNHPNCAVMAAPQCLPNYQQTYYVGLNNGKLANPSCFNCGSSNHVASDCKEVTMEAISGNYHLDYTPKSDDNLSHVPLRTGLRLQRPYDDDQSDAGDHVHPVH